MNNRLSTTERLIFTVLLLIGIGGLIACIWTPGDQILGSLFFGALLGIGLSGVLFS